MHALDPAMRLDVVELRAAVIAVAPLFYAAGHRHHRACATADAMDFVRARPVETRYDLIFSDLYSAFAMDPQQGTQTFLENCAARLNDGGWLVLNYHDLPDENSLLYHSLQRIFGTVLFCVAPSGNVIIYATPACDAAAERAAQPAASSGERCSAANSATCHAK
ncbi:hypothetical protein M8494_11355 [Serratia ureilytica]